MRKNCDVLINRISNVYKSDGENYKKHDVPMLKESGLEDIIAWYAGTFHDDINDYLRNKKNSDPKIETEIHYLTNRILQAPRLNEDITVYRIVKRSIFKMIKKEIRNKKYVDNGFVSTSLSKRNDFIAEQKDDLGKLRYIIEWALLVIDLPKGTPAIYVDDYIDIRRDETELLLPCKCSFTYLERPFDCIFGYHFKLELHEFYSPIF